MSRQALRDIMIIDAFNRIFHYLQKWPEYLNQQLPRVNAQIRNRPYDSDIPIRIITDG
ncbi:hypothetical protein ACUNV4_21440 [Granulosicoccus sp. 3-233]|uniref:hypothetical protein n=1 Tax=Granulosicoccus sp. 3-233 TaxID=3417969 RepID=UPI003D34B4EF